MREFELSIDENLLNGLTPFLISSLNSKYLSQCLGFRLAENGLEAYVEKSNPIPATIDMLYYWPFPQFIAGELWNILVVRDSLVNHEDVVYQVSNDHSTITHIFSVDQLTFGLGTLMEIADFGEYAFMTNGVIMIYWNPTLSNWIATTSLTNVPMMRTICNFKGQAVGGNVVSSWHDCDSTFYIWSKIGEMDFTPDDKNTAGYRRCPYGGEVYNVRRLGDQVIGYSSKGITLISPVTSPAPTFGFKELHDIGLINQGAINGSLNRHVYIGEDYVMREVTQQGIKELGYGYYMKQLIGEDIIVNYDKAEEDFYIGNSTKTFLLSTKGLTELPQHPSTVWRLNNNTYMLPATVDDYSPIIVTEPLDMGYSGQKTITSMETNSIGANDLEIGVDCSYDNYSFSSSDFKPLNNQGIGSIIASGNSFKLKLRASSLNNDFIISYLKARYKMTDLRGIRGVYAPPPRGQ